MFQQKDFFIRMCEMENVTAQELQKLTGKSKSVVYEWLNYSNVKSFPSYESLSKIVCRLGITIDDLLKCKSNKLVDYQNYRRYKEYIIGDLFNLHMSETLVNDLDSKYILNCYVNDCNQLRLIIDNYIDGMQIDENELDLLCENVQPVVVSDVEYAFDDFGGGACYLLNSKTILDYKDRTELYIDRIENDPDYKSTTHEIYFPNADKMILMLAEEDISILKKHMFFLSDYERIILMKNYLDLAVSNRNYDKKYLIFKLLYSGCKTIERIENTISDNLDLLNTDI